MENYFLSKFWSPRSTELLKVEEFFADENFEQKIYIYTLCRPNREQLRKMQL
jgi:hypothetical protein